MKNVVGRIVFVALFEIGAFIPIRARSDVHDAVVVEVAEVRALAPELVGQLDFLESVKQVVFGRSGQHAQRKNKRRQRRLEHSPLLQFLRRMVKDRKKRKAGCRLKLSRLICNLRSGGSTKLISRLGLGQIIDGPD